MATAAAEPAAARADGAAAVPVVRRRRETRGHVDARRSSRSPASRSTSRPGSSRCSTRSASARCRSRSAGRRRRPLVHTVRAVGAVTEAICASRAAARCSACAGRSGRVAGRGRGRAQTSSSSPAGIGLAPLRPVRRCTRSTGARDYGDVALLYGARTPGDLLYRERARAVARRTSTVDVTVDAADAGWARQGRRRPEARPRRAASTPRATAAFVCGPEIMMRFTVEALARARRRRRSGSTSRWSATCAAASATAATASSARRSSAATGRSTRTTRVAPLARGEGAVSAARKPKLAVWKFASCDGCQLSLLDCEDELLALAGEVEIAYFLEAHERATVEGPYDLSLVEGSITTAARRRADPARCAAVSTALVTIGACATAGGIQALRNFADVEEFVARRLRLARVHLDARDLDADRRPRPGRLRAARLPDRQAPAARGRHARSCTAASPSIPSTSVCIECKRRGIVCVMVAHGTPCLGPVTHAGCGALCPAYDRGCYGCFGPMETPNTRLADAAAAGARHGRARRRARLPHLQRDAPSRSGRQRERAD